MTKDGRVFEWSGQNICICTKCEEIFNSVGAFDAHLRTNKKGRKSHDHSWMPRNSAGRKVTSLREATE